MNYNSAWVLILCNVDMNQFKYEQKLNSYDTYHSTSLIRRSWKSPPQAWPRHVSPQTSGGTVDTATNPYNQGLFPGLGAANERRCYFVTTSLIGWMQTYNQPCNLAKYPVKTYRYTIQWPRMHNKRCYLRVILVCLMDIWIYIHDKISAEIKLPIFPWICIGMDWIVKLSNSFFMVFYLRLDWYFRCKRLRCKNFRRSFPWFE